VIYAIGVVFLVWAVAFVLSIVHHLGRKWFTPPNIDTSAERRPSWAEIALYDFLFFNVIPGLVVVYFFPFMPMSGFRFGVALGLIGFLLGAAPVCIMLGLRRERPPTLIVYDLFFQVIKMLVCFALIGAFYPP